MASEAVEGKEVAQRIRPPKVIVRKVKLDANRSKSLDATVTRGPSPVTVQVCSECGGRWDDHIDLASSNDPEMDRVVDYGDCIEVLKNQMRGPRGEPGRNGVGGPSGYNGAQGSSGPQGFQGMQGYQGAMGIPGAYGPQGSTGVQGIRGEFYGKEKMAEVVREVIGDEYDIKDLS